MYYLCEGRSGGGFLRIEVWLPCTLPIRSIRPMPQRVQLSRRKGWRMPPDTVRVSRPGPWGNPFAVGGIDPQTGGVIANRARAVDLFEHALDPARAARARHELKGRNLACWCPLDEPCHADILLRIANT
jgi:hypothetical protein